MGEPVEGGVGATTHSAHNQRGGWGRGGDALGAGEEGDTEEGHQRMLGADGRREGGEGRGREAGQHPRLGKDRELYYWRTYGLLEIISGKA